MNDLAIRLLLAGAVLFIAAVLVLAFAWLRAPGNGPPARDPSAGYRLPTNAEFGRIGRAAVMVMVMGLGILLVCWWCSSSATILQQDRPTPSPAAQISTRPPPPVRVFTGRGMKATPKFSLRSGLATFYLNHNGQDNFAVWLMNDQGERINLLANEIGTFSGSKPVGIEQAGTYLLGVQADGSWTIRIEQ